ncbi:HNH endonuclease [Natronobacterium gregoryi]|uniref:HNH endonuclease n=2 Tax=Natronobacterium gregoryi TaxID=44930 RepID=L0AEU9_NATGS|nr:HNH endonuclease [Natronobacterium gregoryi]AFZ72366.1 hypothetical protein Natgr_1139 [Natronobacterium gregoryi SP2]ELY64249.1 hypothetical protein C490_14710 [Natronobacterium gregoryi SP2]PLK20319.1 HNH endonuclease [Natronobacterium gregoryi SP2]SFJ22206.1 hypothetical protein SAMN05443661_11831 [Natronobacterium gregoryi]
MTSREWHGDRDAVLDRDDHTCRRCGASGDDETVLRLYPVGDVPLEGSVHESALVTVCSPCFASLRRSPTAADAVRLDADDLFELVRETTQRQGVTVSAVASFASLSTSLPGDLEDGDLDEAGYVQARREVLLAIDSVPSRLERLTVAETDHLGDNIVEPLETVVESATQLQSELHRLVTLGESIVAGLDRCHGCLEPRAADEADGRCPTCGLEYRNVDGWRSDGEVAFELLYDEVNETLQAASDTTESLTEGAAGLAEGLQS